MICSCNIDITWTNHVISILHDLDVFDIRSGQLVSILGWYHWPCNIDITKYRFYMAARIEPSIISELAATDLLLSNNLQHNIIIMGKGEIEPTSGSRLDVRSRRREAYSRGLLSSGGG